MVASKRSQAGLSAMPRPQACYNMCAMKPGTPKWLYSVAPPAALSGIWLWLSFPKPDMFPLAFIALAPLLLVMRGLTARGAFGAGYLAGIAYFFGTQYWLYHSVHFYGGVPLWLSLISVLLLAMYEALYIGAFAALCLRVNRGGVPYVIAAPVFWTALEYMRGHALTGFPWSALGYSQYRFLHFIQIADIVGLYGVSFLVAAINGAVADWWAAKGRPSRPVMTASAALAVLLLASLAYGHVKLAQQRPGRELTASVIQGSIEQDMKWDLAYQQNSMDIYNSLSREAALSKPQLIVWPESATPFYFGSDRALTAEVLALTREIKTPLLTGVDIIRSARRTPTGMVYEFTNSAALIGPSGEVIGMYDKMHLVPFGEYIPLRSIFFFVEKLSVGIGDFNVGGDATILRLDDGTGIGTAICYEIIFPEQVREFYRDGRASVIVNITNDAWFGTTAGPYQHWAMASMRAVENRKPVIRAANTGISGMIDSSGRIIASTRINERTELTHAVRTDETMTLYTRYGDVAPVICVILGIIVLAITRGKRLQ